MSIPVRPVSYPARVPWAVSAGEFVLVLVLVLVPGDSLSSVSLSTECRSSQRASLISMTKRRRVECFGVIQSDGSDHE